MMPVYMDSSQPCQMRPQGYYYQGFGNNSQHMSMDAPSPCHGSYVQGHFPAYNAHWPPFYPLQVPHHQCCMSHSGFYPNPPHGPYVPPCYAHPAFPVGYQPLYDSDKDVPGKPVGFHCGKCSSSPQKNGRGVVIEEHEPEIEKGDQGEVVLPVRSTNCPYPIIWIPHENYQEHRSSPGSGNHNQPPSQVNAPEKMMMQKNFPKSWNSCSPFDNSAMKSLIQSQDGKKVTQNGKSVELPISKLRSLLEGHDMKEAQIQKNKEKPGQLQYPTSWIPSHEILDDVDASERSNEDREKMQNGKTVECPFDINKLNSLLQGQDVKETQTQKNKEEPGQLPYPIFWIPSYGKWEDVEASESKESGNKERNMESCASDHHGNEGQINQKESKEGNCESNVLSDAEEKSFVRDIPVQNHLQEPRNIPVKLSENQLPKPAEPIKKIANNEPVKNTEKEKSSSPSKASTLPPVCLRVDPLPKKRNGGSKSLSPPKRKEQSIASEETKVMRSLCSKKAESRTAPEACSVKCEEVKKETKMSEGNLHAIGTEQESVESNPILQERSNCEIVKPCETKENREQPAKKTLTEDEAARIIQSRYRGYDVRRWEPTKKLKEIATIREQMGDVKNRIQALEVSTDQHIEEKEIVILGEMVMNLLLKVDAVQGLHPSIRHYRKSLARELSSIQEKLDSVKYSSAAIAEKEVVNEQFVINSQPCESPENLEHSQLAEENKMVSDSNTKKVLVLSCNDLMSDLNRTDEQPNADAEEGTGLFETLGTDPEQTTENEVVASSTNIPLKIGEGETFVSKPSLADGNGMTVTKIEENKPVVESLEEPLNELRQVVEETHGTSSTQDPDNATEVSDASQADASEKEDTKEDDDTVLPSGKDVEVSELPARVTDDETQILSQDSSSYAHEGQVTAMEPEIVRKEETDVYHLLDNYKGIGQESSELQDEKQQSRETEVTVREQTQGTEQFGETGVVVREQPAETGVVVKEQPLQTGGVKEEPPETEATEPEISEETKRLMEENQRFKETMETLVKAGREQLEVISKLTGRVRSLEKKLSRKKRTQIRRRATKPISSSSIDAVL
ncbi:hypothetical protein CARUB_v10022545mg [Capsella rubella]|uniref:BAG domain-containing protein n=1 Tax=Capsella rubella TaxID=81985 RepID=R0HMQ3_9BRAS|nr:BAG family molecular chaperone regulator 6 [Capsella rubella]EOA26495.1 hypothetical protein CARUB_v10022545mg [Capsella rubella]